MPVSVDPKPAPRKPGGVRIERVLGCSSCPLADWSDISCNVSAARLTLGEKAEGCPLPVLVMVEDGL